MNLICCSKCGKHSPDWTTLCIHCGADLCDKSITTENLGNSSFKPDYEENMIYYCKNCYENKDSKTFRFVFRGYIPSPTRTNENGCVCCGNINLEKTDMTYEDYGVLCKISKDVNFFEAMMKLKKDNIIEYESKMAQFRMQVEAYTTKQQAIKIETKHFIKCPRCGSTAVTTGARGANYFWGFMGASKTVNRCGKCGYTWKPRG